MQRQKDDEERRPLRLAFAKRFQQILDTRDLSHRDFAVIMDWSNHTRIYRWLHGNDEPTPWVVFEIESRLNLKGGTLSSALGYLPPGSAKAPKPATVKDAIDADPLLDRRSRAALSAAYGHLVS